MKDFVVKFGRILWDIGAWFVMAVIVLCGVTLLFSTQTLLAGILTLIFGPVICVIVWQFAYVFFDIRDKLAELVELKKQESGITTEE